MSDETHLDAGDAATNAAAGKGISQNHNAQSVHPRQNMRGENNYYNGDNSQSWIVSQINDHAQQIRELTYRLDDLPNKLYRLEGRVDVQTDKLTSQGERVRKLEDVEVVIRKDEVIIKPITPPVSLDVPMRTLTFSLIIIGFLIFCAVVYLVYLQAGAHG